MSNMTISLTGSEVRADFFGTNAWLRNDGTSTIYASTSPGVTEGEDGVVSVPAGGSAPVFDAHGTVYLIGTGSVQLIGSDYSENPFKTSAQSGGSGADEVARAAIEAHAGNSSIHLTAEQLDSAVSAHNTNENAHTGMFAKSEHTHKVSDIEDFPEIPSAGVTEEQLTEAVGGKMDKVKTVSVIITTTGWQSDDDEKHPFYYDIPVPEATAYDRADVHIKPDSAEAALAAGFDAKTQTGDGYIRIRAERAPTAVISAEYQIFGGAV